MNFVFYDGRKIEYELTRKNVKNINLRIRCDSSVAVSANYFVPQSEIDKFILANAEKILSCIDKFSKLNKDKAEYKNNEKIVLLGKQYTIKVLQKPLISYSFENSSVILFVKNPDDFSERKKSYDSMTCDLAKKVFTQIVEDCYPNFKNVCKTVPQLKIRNMKSQWGNCHYNKNIITLNLKLIQYDINVIKFVVLHEYCHFIYPNHSKGFYCALSSVMSDWKKYDRILKNQFDL